MIKKKIIIYPILAFFIGLIIGSVIGGIVMRLWDKAALYGIGIGLCDNAFKLRNKGEFERAIALLNQAKALAPYEELIILGLGETYEAKGEFALALEEYQVLLGLEMKKPPKEQYYIKYLKTKIKSLKEKLKQSKVELTDKEQN